MKQQTIWLAALALLPGCDVSGLVDLGGSLLTPEAALLDTPGRQLVQGSYSNLMIDGSIESGGNVIAFRIDAEQPTIAVVPFKDGSPCEITPGVAFARLSSRIDVALPSLLAVLDDHQTTNESTDVGTLNFYGFDCQRRLPQSPNTPLPRVLFPAAEPWGALTLTGAGELKIVDATTATITTISDQVSAFSVTADHLWTIENGQLVGRSDRLTVQAELGRDVEYYIPTGGKEVPVVFGDADGLHAYRRDEELTTLSTTACNVVPLGPDAIAFHDPCDERRLNVVTTADKLSARKTGELIRLVGPENVRLTDTQVTFGGGSSVTELIILQTPSAAATEGDLLYATLKSGVATKGNRHQLEPSKLGSGISLVGGQPFRDYAEGKGTLMNLARNASHLVIGMRALAQDVAQVPGGTPFSLRGVLSEFDGTEGRLVRLTETSPDKIEVHTIARNVPLQEHQIDDEQELIAFVAELDEENAGTLVLADDKKEYVLAGDVYVNTVRFLDEPFGVIYLKKNGDRPGASLHVHLIDPGLDLQLHPTVSEYRSIPWPSPGVLYSVPDGEDQGLWFAKAR